MSDNIHVAVRMRPLIKREKQNQSEIHWVVNDNVTITQIDNYGKPILNISYTFDRVFAPNESNAIVYEELCHPIVQSVMKGFHGTIFAYGQTSSGKTYTMSGTENNPGLVSFTINSIFDAIENMPEREFLLRVSYMEIYNECISDLLSDSVNQNLKVFENSDGQLLVQDLKEETVKSSDEIIDLWNRGENKRHTGGTCMNEKSSRSHSIFRIIVESRNTGDDLDNAVNVSHLNLVDLAGSERSGHTGSTGERFKEGCHINKSLLTLGQVISRLSLGEVQYVNYRDSRLTRILQTSLGGNTRTAIICTVTPASTQQTLSTLQFASHAKCIKNKPVINEVLTDAAMLKKCKVKLKQLNEELAVMKAENQSAKVTEMERELQQKDKKLGELEKMIKNLTENVIVSRQAPRKPLPKKARRETWGGYFQSLSIMEETCDLSDSLSNSRRSDSNLNFTKMPPNLFEADLDITEKMKSYTAETIQNTSKKQRKTVIFKLPPVDKEVQTEQMSEKNLIEDYELLKTDYNKMKKDYFEIQEMTKLEKWIFSEEQIGRDDLITILYGRINDREERIEEIQKNLYTKYFSPRKCCKSIKSEKETQTSYETPNEKQILESEIKEYETKLKINNEMIKSLQAEKEDTRIKLEQIHQKNKMREDELCQCLEKAYKEIEELKTSLNESNASKFIKEKQYDIIESLQKQISDMSIVRQEIENENIKYKEQEKFLEQENKKYRDEIKLLSTSIKECKVEVASFNEPLKNLANEISELLNENNELETLISQLKEKNHDIKKYSNVLSSELINLKNLNLPECSAIPESSLIDNIEERLCKEEWKLVRYYWYQIQNIEHHYDKKICEINKKWEDKLQEEEIKYNMLLTTQEEESNAHSKIIQETNKTWEDKLQEEETKYKKLIATLEDASNDHSQKLHEMEKMWQEKLKEEEIKYNVVICNLEEKCNVQYRELEQLRKTQMEALKGSNDTTIISQLKENMTSLLKQLEEYKQGVKKSEDKYEILLELNNNLQKRLERKCKDIFNLQMEIEEEKGKQECVRSSLKQEVHKIKTENIKTVECIQKQLHNCEEQFLSKEKENCEIKILQDSLLSKINCQGKEIKEYQLLLERKTQEFHTLELQNQAIKTELESKIRLDICNEKCDVSIQCLTENLEERDTTDQSEIYEREIESLKNETENLSKMVENLTLELNDEGKQLQFYKYRIEELQNELNKTKIEKMIVSTQTDDVKLDHSPSTMKNLKLKKDLAEQKMLVADLQNQLLKENEYNVLSTKEIEFLKEKIEQLKMQMRRIQQRTNTSFYIHPSNLKLSFENEAKTIEFQEEPEEKENVETVVQTDIEKERKVIELKEHNSKLETLKNELDETRKLNETLIVQLNNEKKLNARHQYKIEEFQKELEKVKGNMKNDANVETKNTEIETLKNELEETYELNRTLINHFNQEEKQYEYRIDKLQQELEKTKIGVEIAIQTDVDMEEKNPDLDEYSNEIKTLKDELEEAYKTTEIFVKELNRVEKLNSQHEYRIEKLQEELEETKLQVEITQSEKSDAVCQCSTIDMANQVGKENDLLKRDIIKLSEKISQLANQKSQALCKIKNLQKELNENKQKETSVAVTNQTDENVKLKRSLNEQKMLVAQLESQLSEERKKKSMEMEENEYLKKRIEELKIQMRRFQQPTDATYTYRNKTNHKLFTNEMTVEFEEEFEQSEVRVKDEALVEKTHIENMDNNIGTMELQKSFNEQKKLIEELHNQLATEVNNHKTVLHENKNLKERIKQMEQLSGSSSILSQKELSRDSRNLRDISNTSTPEMYEGGGGSGIINNFKVEWSENQLHMYKKKVEYLKKENAKLKLFKSEKKCNCKNLKQHNPVRKHDTEEDREFGENFEVQPSEQACHLKEKIQSVNHGNASQPVTNRRNVSYHSFNNDMELSSSCHHHLQ